MSVSLQQPMRPAEIELVGLANQNEAAIAQEIVDRTSADNVLQTNIDTEETERKAADTTLQNNIDAEESARTAADTTLQNNIDAETTARESADTTLTNSLNAEVAARQELDTTVTNLGTQLNQTNTNLETEVTNRTNADSELQASIDEINAKFPVAAASIANDAITSDKILDGSVTSEKLETALKQSISSIPDMEFGTSNIANIPAGAYTDLGIPFAAAKAKSPVVLCEIQKSTGNSDERLLDIQITNITNDHFSVRVYNKTAIDITNATLGWMAITGR